jgi:hypothetical protein
MERTDFTQSDTENNHKALLEERQAWSYYLRVRLIVVMRIEPIEAGNRFNPSTVNPARD